MGLTRAATPLVIGFLDLTMYSREVERRDDVEVADTIDAYYGIVTRGVSEANGTTVKFIGDAGLVVFPLKEADRAVDAILRLALVIDDFFAERGWECRLSAKLHAGAPVAGEFGYADSRRFDVIGRAVNETAMLEGTGIRASATLLAELSPETRRRLENRSS